MSGKELKRVYKYMKEYVIPFSHTVYPAGIQWSACQRKERFMALDNPFGADIDDDGLPRYSPDRKNIAAYHMFKLGMTDRLPDPEDTHTPFFRTPSYYREKAEKEREAQAGLPAPVEAGPVKPDKPVFSKERSSDADEKPAFPPLSMKPEPFAPDASGQYAQKEQKEQRGQGGQADSSGGASFGQQVFNHIFGDAKPAGPNRRFQNGQANGLPESGETGKQPLSSAQPEQPVLPETRSALPEVIDVTGQSSPVTMEKAGKLPEQRNGTPPFSLEPAEDSTKAREPYPDWHDNAGRRDDWVKTFDFSTLQRLIDERNRMRREDDSGLFPLLFLKPESLLDIRLREKPVGAVQLAENDAGPTHTGFQPEGEGAWWVNEDVSLAENQLEDFPNNLEPTSAGMERQRSGKGKGGTPEENIKTVFKTVNPDNPGFEPAKVAYVDITKFQIRKGRYLVSEKMTYDINRDLTATNMGYPIGINFRFLSVLEGGSGHIANIPLNRADAENNKDLNNRSGVTVGAGFDLGQIREGPAGTATLRKYGFPEPLVQKLSPYLGLKRRDAYHALGKKPLTLSDRELDFINRQVMTLYGNKCIVQWDKVTREKRKKGVNRLYFHELTSGQQTIIFSRYYHQGPGWRERNKEMYRSMSNNDWDEVARQLEKLIQKDENGPKWMRGRLQIEWEFLKDSN